MYNILIIDDHVLIRDGMRLLLNGLDASVEVTEASSCEEGLQLIDSLAPLDVILMDLALPGTGGLAGIPLFHKKMPDTPIIVLSASEIKRDAQDALDAGAQGFISKSSSGDVILCAIRLVLSGGIYIPPSLVNREAEEVLPTELPDKPVQLTPRQLEVLNLLAQGKPNKVIAHMLNMAESTVRVHTTAIFKALGATNRTEAALIASKQGLIAELAADAEQNNSSESL